jgi:hypothetical protein
MHILFVIRISAVLHVHYFCHFGSGAKFHCHSAAGTKEFIKVNIVSAKLTFYFLQSGRTDTCQRTHFSVSE